VLRRGRRVGVSYVIFRKGMAGKVACVGSGIGDVW